MKRGSEAYLGDQMAIYINGSLAGYVDRFSLRVEYDMKDIQIPRVKIMQYKVGVARATGTMGGFLWNGYLQRAALEALDGGIPDITVVGRMKNTDTGEDGSVAASGLIFTAADVANWQVGTEIKIEQPFVCTNVSLNGFATPR